VLKKGMSELLAEYIALNKVISEFLAVFGTDPDRKPETRNLGNLQQ
jgi:hypothetical protein